MRAGGGRPAEDRCSGHKFSYSVLTSIQRNICLLKFPVQQHQASRTDADSQPHCGNVSDSEATVLSQQHLATLVVFLIRGRDPRGEPGGERRFESEKTLSGLVSTAVCVFTG